MDENSFKLLSELPLNVIQIGDLIDFSFTLNSLEKIEDDMLIVEMSASYNGFSSLLFCGVPQVTITGDETLRAKMYGSTYDKVFEGISVN